MERKVCHKYNMSEQIILVDKNDKEIGAEEKMKVHKEENCIERFLFLFLTSGGNCFCRKGRK